jgi:hypothetical protein
MNFHSSFLGESNRPLVLFVLALDAKGERVIGPKQKDRTTTLFSKNLFESHLEGVNRVNLKFINLSTTTSRVSVRNMNESEREGKKTNHKQIKSETQ